MAKEELTPVPINKLSEKAQALHDQFYSAITDEEALAAVNDPDFPVHAINEHHETPLSHACYCNMHKAAIALIKKNGTPINYQDELKLTALHYAVKHADVSLVEALIDGGALLNLLDKHKRTPLHLACSLQTPKIAMALVNAGAPLDTADSTLQTPLHMLLNQKVISLKDVALRMIEKGAPLGAVDVKGCTPLHTVSLTSYADEVGVVMVERLKTEGKTDYLNTQDYDKHTPLHTAAQNGNETYAKALIDAKARLDIPDKYGDTALGLACSSGLDDLGKYMVEKGAPFSGTSLHGDGPLMTCFTNQLEKTALAIVHKMRAQELPDWLFSEEDGLVMKSGMDKVVIELIKKGLPLYVDNYQDDIFSNRQYEDMMRQFVSHVILPYAIRKHPNVVEELKREIRIHSHRPGHVYQDFIEDVSGWLEYDMFPAPSSSDVDKLNQEVTRIIEHNKESPGNKESLKDFVNNNPTIQHYFWPLRLAKTWHHPAINIPREYVPLAGSGEWHPIMQELYAPDGSAGLSITNLTSGEDLKFESDKLDHCVGRHSGYDMRCMNSNHENRSHILSIGSTGVDGARIPVSTIEMKIVPKDDTNKALNPIFGNDQYALSIEQHRGRNDHTPPAEAQRLLSRFLADVKSGKVNLITDNDKLGETQDSIRKRGQYSKLEQAMGVPISWVIDPKSEGYDNLSKVFDRFRMSERAAMTGIDQRGHRIYDVERTDDRYTHFNHFIDGWAKIDANGNPTGERAFSAKELKLKEGEMAVSLRDLDLPSWMQATNIEDTIEQVLKDFCSGVDSSESEHKHFSFDRPPIPGERGSHINRAMVITHQGTVKPAPHELSAA